MNQFASGFRSRTDALIETALPIALDPAAMQGASLLGTDGREYTSLRWPTPTDPYQWVSAAQIAEEVAEGVVRTITTDVLIEVRHTFEAVPGERYPSLRQALTYLASRAPAASADFINVEVRVKAGHIESEQFMARNINLGYVRVVFEDPEVPINPAILSKNLSLRISLQDDQPTTGALGQRLHSLCFFGGGTIPRFEGGRFFLVGPDHPAYTGPVPQDPLHVALAGAYAPIPTGFEVSNCAGSFEQGSGANGFERGLAAGGQDCHVSTVRANFDNNVTGIRLLNGATLTDFGSTARNCSLYGLNVVNGSKATLQPFGDINSDFRVNAGTTGLVSANDIFVQNGSEVITAPLAVGTILGGCNLPHLIRTRDGVLTDQRITDVTRVIDSGSGPNGEWVRFADGTQRCRLLTVATALAITTTAGAIWTNGTPFVWNFPVGFLNTNNLVCIASPRSSGNFWARARATSATAADVKVWATASTTNDLFLELKAEGRWRA